MVKLQSLGSTLNIFFEAKASFLPNLLGLILFICILQVVYQFGGMYLDTDSVCQEKFPNVLQHSFVAYVFEDYNNISNGIFGFPKKSRFLRLGLQNKCL